MTTLSLPCEQNIQKVFNHVSSFHVKSSTLTLNRHISIPKFIIQPVSLGNTEQQLFKIQVLVQNCSCTLNTCKSYVQLIKVKIVCEESL